MSTPVARTGPDGWIAVNRFGLGARPGDAVPAKPRRWLTDQFDRYDPHPPALASLADAGTLVQDYRREQRDARRDLPAPATAAPMPAPAPSPPAASVPLPPPGRPAIRDALQPARRAFNDDARTLYQGAVAARTASALATEAPFVERMVHFWSNHFCISADNAELSAFAGQFERDAIRPHVLGRFEDMALAAERHPAMLLYLNQANSVGPDSPAAGAPGRRQRGLNENLAREIMELHTLGVRSGYTQADVTEFARALTGWTVDGLGPGGLDHGDPDRFAFRPRLHEPGTRLIVGRRYDQADDDQARAALVDLARAPATATHVAVKLARHFAGDQPPPALVTRLAETFARTRGDLPAVYHALIAAPEPWQPAAAKFKTPWEWTVSGLRGLGLDADGKLPVAGLQAQLGQPVWKPGSPAGWDDSAAAWAAPDALMRRVELAQRLTAPLADTADARALAPRLAAFGPATTQQIARAESPAGALALLLVSPEFLRR